jgi:hypothetical protein
MSRIVHTFAVAVLVVVLVAMSGPFYVGMAILVDFPLLKALAATAIAACVIRGIVRWINRRDDPRFVKFPTTPTRHTDTP